MRRTLLYSIACSALAGCWGGDDAATPPAGTADAAQTETEVTTAVESGTAAPAEPAAGSIALVPMRPQALRRCRRFPELAEACPLLVPEGHFGPGSGAYQAFSRARFPHPAAWAFSLQQGGEHPGRPELDRPPETVHVVATAGPPFRTALPSRVKLRDGLLEERRRKPLFLGRATWGGHEGVLLLAPPFPRGGLQANHLLFSWAGGSKTISLHGWEPFSEVPGVLRRVVESIPREPR